MVEAALASFSQKQPDQDRTLQRAAEIRLTPAMAPNQWPQQPELLPIHPRYHLPESSGPNGLVRRLPGRTTDCGGRSGGNGHPGRLWSWLFVRRERDASAAAQNHDDSDDDNDDDNGTQAYVHDFLFPSGTGTHRCRREPSAPVRAFQPVRATLLPRCDMHPYQPSR